MGAECRRLYSIMGSEVSYVRWVSREVSYARWVSHEVGLT